MLCPKITYLLVGKILVRTLAAIISLADNCPGAALKGKVSWVTGVKGILMTREYLPTSPKINEMLGITGLPSREEMLDDNKAA
mmetsp:Transcript_17850/g.20004  ORF Transcript_17850/g.20004 Transcript_17850/m.20004 type:complete len:83 (+) Transcript_17850:2873-3121(+)